MRGRGGKREESEKRSAAQKDEEEKVGAGLLSRGTAKYKLPHFTCMSMYARSTRTRRDTVSFWSFFLIEKRKRVVNRPAGGRILSVCTHCTSYGVEGWERHRLNNTKPVLGNREPRTLPVTYEVRSRLYYYQLIITEHVNMHWTTVQFCYVV